MPKGYWYSPNFLSFLKHRFPFILLANIKEVRVQLFVIVIDLEEGAPVCIHQVFCIYLEHKVSVALTSLTFPVWQYKMANKVQQHD